MEFLDSFPVHQETVVNKWLVSSKVHTKAWFGLQLKERRIAVIHKDNHFLQTESFLEVGASKTELIIEMFPGTHLA